MRRRLGLLAVAASTVGVVAAVAAPVLGDVSAHTRPATPVDSTVPGEVVATEPTDIALPSGPEAVATETTETTVDETVQTTIEVDRPSSEPETTVETSLPESTAAPATVGSTIAGPETATPDTVFGGGAIGPTAADDTYAVTVLAVCDFGVQPAIRITNLSTADVRVAFGSQSMVLEPDEGWRPEWPLLDGVPPTFDPTPKWDAVRLDGIPPEVFDLGVLALPDDCPPRGVPSAPQDLASRTGGRSVELTWLAPESDGGAAITDYTVEHNAVPFEDDDWTLVDDGVGTGTSAVVAGLTNGETYLFRVRAVNANGAGMFAEVKDAPNVVPSTPNAVTVVATPVRGELRLSWTAPTDGLSIFTYEIERSLDDVAWSPLTEVGGDTTWFVDTGLVRPQRYHYRVTAHNSAGRGPMSTPASGVPNDVPTAPRSLQATATNHSGQIRLRWLAPLSNGGSPLTGYTLQRSSDGASGWRNIRQNVAGTSYLVTGQSNGTRWYFRIVADNAPGSSTPSNVAHAVPLTAPSAVRSVTATATGVSGRIRLDWVAPLSSGGSPVFDYVIYRSPDGISDWTWINDGINLNTSFTVRGLSNGQRYHFRIFARSAVRWAPPGNVPSAVPATSFTAPRDLVATPTNRSGQVRLAWLRPLSNGGAAIVDYVVQRSADGRTGWVTIGDGVNANTAYTVTGLSNGVRYHFRVVARSARGYSLSSNIVTAVPRTVPSAPRRVAAASASGPGQVTLTWVFPASNGGSAFTDYLIQRSADGSTGWTSLSDGLSTSTSYTVTGLTSGIRHYFRIYARNDAGWSPVSAVVHAAAP